MARLTTITDDLERLIVDERYESWVNRYVDKWERCAKCQLHVHSFTRPIMRGTIPFEILLVGEAPGESEDLRGFPFVGPAGKLLNHILDESLGGTSYLITNCVICTPPRIEGKIREPSIQEKNSCSGHIRELVGKFVPRKIIALGQHANNSLRWVEHDHVVHPASLFHYPERKMDIAILDIINQMRRIVRK